MASETVRDLLNQLLKASLGYIPMNNSIKPAHIANGLFRAIIGGYYDTTALNKTAVWWVRNQKGGYDEERNPSKAILSEYAPAWGDPPPHVDHVSTFRRVLKVAYGADGALFAGSAKTSYTLASRYAVTNDPSHNHVGSFLYHLLTEDREPNDSPTISWLKDALESTDDAWSTIGLPLLSLAEWQEDNPYTATPVLDVAHSPVMLRLRDAIDRVARFEQLKGSKLSSLRRLTVACCFAVYVHLITRWVEICGKEHGDHPPILLDVTAGRYPSVAAASYATFRAAAQSVEQFLRHILSAYAIEDLHLATATDDEMIAQCVRLESRVKELDRLTQRYKALRQSEGHSEFDALIRSLVDHGLESATGNPMGFLKELGRRSGFIGPWGNRAEHKRYMITADFIEVLVLATVDMNDAIEFPEFLDRLRSHFGIVLGRDVDDDTIRKNNLGGFQFGLPVPINEDELRINVKLFKQQLEEIGYARSYADGTSIVFVK